ncbi:MAG: AbrB/MazE/SpoVT family DNA-binding domain-containing protein [Thermosynechococcaceae cyanobacterium]
MKTKVQKWGNSLALRIPKSFAAEILLQPDTEVELSMVKGKLVVTPILETSYSLEQLLEGVTEDNIHAEVDTGVSVGNEAW